MKLKIGDLVKFRNPVMPVEPGIVIEIDDSHRQTVVKVLMSGRVFDKVWEKNLRRIGRQWPD